MLKTGKKINEKSTIGILGGMGPYATNFFLKRILDLTPVKLDKDHFHTIIDNNVKIYPNPTNEYLNIEFKNYRSQSFIIIFENTLGQEILRHEIQEGNQDFSQQFNISEFSKGIYYIKLLFENTKIVEIISKN